MKQWALIIGVGQRSDDSQAMAITSKDATRVATELEKRCDLDRTNIALILEKEATKNKILAELESLINKTRNNEADIIWIYFSGHGSQLQSNGTIEYFLIANDTIGTDLINSAILGSEFIDKINQINTKKLLLLLDCCHAGGISMEKCNIPFDAEQLLSRSNRVVISASHAEEIAFPSQPLSVFTFAFIEGLAGAYFNENDRDITIFDLAMYIRERVYPLTKRKQRPQFSIFNNKKTENFVLINYPNGKPPLPAFDSEFILSDGKGKRIDINTPIETDVEFRKQFEWMKNINQGTIIAQRVDIGDKTIMGDIINGDKITQIIYQGEQITQDLEKERVLNERYVKIKEIYSKIVEFTTNLNRYKSGKLIGGFIENNDIVPLTQIFELLQKERYLITEKFYNLFWQISQLLIRLTNETNTDKIKVLKKEYLVLSEIYHKQMSIMFTSDEGLSRYSEKEININNENYIKERFLIDKKIFNVLILTNKMRSGYETKLIPLKALIPLLDSLFERMTFKGEPKIEMCTKQRWIERVHSAHLTYEAILFFEEDFQTQGNKEQVKLYHELLISISKYVDKMLLGLFKENINLEEIDNLIGTPDFASKLRNAEKNDFQIDYTASKILIEDKFKKPINLYLKKSIETIEKLVRTEE